ncbi:YtxH domain-containing protein [Aggregicoccus sp. 17bor-14]|uniref:YtxH domain-containing protein n=1 Tax=Myxococcaceae TaxID=31 RepID=UPI00129C85FD|nr:MULTISPECIES: YtxH domain-containing protein [Myxococcaceae]MBF5040864.1 YtxH domain-containing protein [Simulacricoccus sp. 17bor-14]MRI86653.1 YtxH domain-containing protein [Aggregicoccus sp. 17bor-14]
MFAKKAKWKTKGLLYKNWLENKLTDDLPRYSKEKWDDFDADDVLNLIGLAKHKPVSTGLGVTGAFLLGAAAGSIVALLLAPKPGSDLRTDVREKAMNYLDKAKNTRSETQASA